MPRDLTPAMVTALEAEVCYPICFVEIEFATGWVRAFTGTGLITWNSVQWGGAGEVSGISEMAESKRIEANGITLTMFGPIAGELMAIALIEGRHGKPGRVYQGFLTAAGAVIADPVAAWSGLVDVINVTTDPKNPAISVRLESRFNNMKATPPRRYTHEDQQMDHPDDRIFEFVTLIQRSTPSYVPPAPPPEE